MTKVCRVCKTEKDLKDYHLSKDRKDGHVEDCKACISLKMKSYYKINAQSVKTKNKNRYHENVVVISEKRKQDRKLNPDKYKTHKSLTDEQKIHIAQYQKEYRTKNREKIKKQRAERRKTKEAKLIRKIYIINKENKDLNFRISCNLRKRIIRAIKGSYKSGSAVKDLGCTIPEFKSYLEKRFSLGMTWENWGINGWHIDHIKPLVSFDLMDPKQFKDAVNYTNLQPLWAKDHYEKSKIERRSA